VKAGLGGGGGEMKKSCSTGPRVFPSQSTEKGPGNEIHKRFPTGKQKAKEIQFVFFDQRRKQNQSCKKGQEASKLVLTGGHSPWSPRVLERPLKQNANRVPIRKIRSDGKRQIWGGRKNCWIQNFCFLVKKRNPPCLMVRYFEAHVALKEPN